MVDYGHMGARIRALAAVPGNRYSGKGMYTCAGEVEFERGAEFTRSEQRAFFRGWRQNMVVSPANDLIRLASYLTAPQLEKLGKELTALVEKWEGLLE